MNQLILLPAVQRAAHAIAALLDRNRHHLEITQAEALVLALLAADGDRTVGEIVEEFGFKRSTITSILNRLEARGLITCRVNSTDRRSLVIGLTTSGGASAQIVLTELIALESEVLEAFSPRDLKSVVWMLTAIKTVAERERRLI